MHMDTTSFGPTAGSITVRHPLKILLTKTSVVVAFRFLRSLMNCEEDDGWWHVWYLTTSSVHLDPGLTTPRSLRGYFNWVVLAVSFLLRSHKHVSLLHLVSCQYSHTLPIENVPEPHTAVTWPRSNIVTIWMKLATLHKDNMHINFWSKESM